jgi:tetratricopeptide (TPR) repeat protein
VAQTVAAESARDPRLQAYDEFKRQFEAGDYAEAAASASRVLELTEQSPGEDRENLLAALMNLATAQRLGGDAVAAEGTYLRVIELIEHDGRPTDARLARANAGLASLYYDARRYDMAVPRFIAAIGILRRNEGLFSEEQLPLLEKLADALTELSQIEDAQRAQTYRMRVAGKRYGEVDPRGVAVTESVGRWYARVGAFDTARALLEKSLAQVESAQGPDSIELVGLLTALAECNRLQLQTPGASVLGSADAERFAMFHDQPPPAALTVMPRQLAGDGEAWLERAAAIVNDHPDASPLKIADVRTQLGDWYQLRQQPDRAIASYRLAWAAAQDVEFEGKPLAETLFGAPLLLYYQRPGYWDRYAARPPEEVEIRSVELEVTVTAEGTIEDPVVKSDADNQDFVDSTMRAARTARYRPRMSDGEPVATTAVRFAQPFMVLVEQPAEAPAGPPAPKPDATEAAKADPQST